MKTFTKLPRKPLPEVVASEIEEAIIQGTFAIGSQLPSEQQLADQFGVSRNVVREAFKFLKERGLIEILNGSGAYVQQPSHAPTSDALGRYIRLLGAHESIADLYEARRLLEGWNARLAAERADEDDLHHLSHCLERMEAHAGSIEKWSEADLEFHLGVAKATHNAFLGILLEPLVDQLRGVIAEGYVVPGAVERGLEAHRNLLALIRARDAEGAYNAILEHLRDSESRVEAKHPTGNTH
ncbi:MAG: FadR family transcriptional regulator [Anaerolineae bacterium]|nr:FadR family transcriptional regulator [Anaerolineae bacterium]